ncbi:hypothetical protein [Candidatus Electrothrix sp.]|uniref:hypothetical protein n=1 Tax=Candidatus Electrothrix sp. TaxID=2170559 RepID=UPI00405711CC
MKTVLYAVVISIIISCVGIQNLWAQSNGNDSGRRLGLGDRELVPLPEHVELPDHVDPPTRPRIERPEWMVRFLKDNKKYGLLVAVEKALDDDVSAKEILTFIIENEEEIGIKRGLKALYCAGADREEVQEAADKLGVTIEDLSIALEESIAECGDKLTLSDRDIINNKPGNRFGLSDRDLVPLPDHVILPEHVTPPTRPRRPSSPSAP